VTVELYTPQLVNFGAQVKNSDLNANLLLIKQAFDSISAYDTASASFVFGPNQRNVLVDLSGAGSGFWLTATLPENPTIGDPPIRVTISRGGFSSVDNSMSSCVVCTSDGANIMGVPTISSLEGLPFLTNTGDSMQFAYIGGTYGWVIVDKLFSAFAPPTDISTVQPWDSFYLNAFHQLDTVIDSTNITNTQIKLVGINQPGLWASFTLADGSSPQTLVTDSGSQTFNGVVGAFTLDFATYGNERVLFTCVGTDAFVVTT